MTTFYEVRDRGGGLVAIHKRTEDADGKRLAWMRPDGRHGLNGTATAALPLYGAHQLDAWPATDTVLVVEGEKAADALVTAGYRAVATVTGASGTPSDNVLADLDGRAVVVWPDADEAGREHMTRIAERLHERATVGWLEPPADAPKGWDAADAIAAGMDVAELLRTADAWPRPVAYRTLADISEAPPAPLLLDWLEHGPNLLIGSPGVGKGMTGAWIVREALAVGMRPMIYDAERRPQEWSRRVAGLGGDRGRVVYVDPDDLGPDAGRPLWDSIEAIRRIHESAGADLLLVDSLLTATAIAEDRLRSDARAPFQYVQALDSLGIVTVSLGHPPKGQPDGEAYGSMAWTAAMRMTWSGTRAEGEGHRVRWRPRKRNERGHVPAFLLTFTYDDAGRPVNVTRDDDERSMRERLLLLLDDWQTTAELVDELLMDDDDVPATRRESLAETVGRTLRRLHRDGAIEREGKGGRVTAKWRKAA